MGKLHLVTERPLLAVILAAGLGTRMRSRTPKVLHPVVGRPMIELVLEACREGGAQEVLAVVSPRQPEVAAHLEGRCRVCPQPEPKGSGDALGQVPVALLRRGDVLVVNGDAPLLRPETVAGLVRAHREGGRWATLATVLDGRRADARVLRGPDGLVARVVEYPDATPEVRALEEVNVGLYCFDGVRLAAALDRLRPDPRSGEVYLTSLFDGGDPALAVQLEDREEALGVNDRVELARAEAALRHRLLVQLMRSGVTVVDPASTFVEATVRVGQDTVLEPFTILRGATVIGERCRIGPFSQLRDTRVGDGATIERSWLDGVDFGAGSDCGPFSRLRPGTRIGEDVHVGSFAELVRSSVGRGSRVPHVSYLGDAQVGENVNVGAGAITANYDGLGKNPTVIEDDAFIGVDTMLRAPVRVGRRARTGAGAVVTRDVPPGMTAVGVPARAIRRRENSR
jgi:bifunctional UDP-N-acetylglucosamine pyrophosphorylase/glucosamine-1-phosphate N-acetyltransferase